MSAPRPPVDPRLLAEALAVHAATATAAATATSTAPATATATASTSISASAAASASLRWLGTSGWRIDVDGRTVLFDPYLTRFKTGLFDGAFRADTELSTDPEVVRERIGAPELVLVSHSHWDHVADVPYIAKSTGARVMGTETTYHLLVAFGVDPGQISVVKGGEVLDFGGITVEVAAGLVPVHWDNFEEPLSEPPRRDPSMDLDGFLAQVHRESPASRIVVPDYRTVYGADMRPRLQTS
ncbi:MBL fold metallo-hydrolase [Streptomyces olivochromogenes]|uniref:MBL fold metallo-hydrolase n=1 Tax=Streptomyces olivochromogenes TaxID=1963 RepID=UPI0036DAC784